MDGIGLNRLEQIADHLESGNLMHKEFDFTTYNSEAPYGSRCGTAGCAVGEFPAIWPEDWGFTVRNKWLRGYDPGLLAHNGRYSTFIDARLWLEITEKEFRHLFLPYYQDLSLGRKLGADATPQEVAANIREFIKIKRDEK